jgi:hypothetical protein
MKRAIVVATLVALVVVLVALLVDTGQPAGPLRPKPTTQRNAPTPTAGGFEEGTLPSPADE